MEAVRDTRVSMSGLAVGTRNGNGAPGKAMHVPPTTNSEPATAAPEQRWPVARTINAESYFAPPWVMRYTRPPMSSVTYNAPSGPVASPVGRCFAVPGCNCAGGTPAKPSANTS
jgi:hypothetical protein